MNDPQRKPQRDDLDQLMSDVLAKNLAPLGLRAAPASTPAAAPIHPPASSGGTPRPLKWDPPTTHNPSPRQLLAQVADNAFQLQRQIELLVTEVTGEQAPEAPIRPVAQGNALLPVINHLAHEIDAAHAGVARLVAYLRERVS